jgi:ABC-type transport system involved in cytochrome bd biosynthesis fused ATPase/permease subunit
MRFESGKVKFVAVDEPSSALDAEGELKLFERLIAAREGKTMVFVTHRFGHLTKHADQIMCVILKETFFVCWLSNIKESFYYF